MNEHPCEYCGEPTTNARYCHKRCSGKARWANVVRTPTSRYRHVQMPDHPLATKDGSIQFHRIVLYDKIGPGPQRCHWCGTPLEWVRGGRGGIAVIPDHVDGDTRNNESGNLVPACVTCNLSRLRGIKDDEQFVTRGDGRRERAIEATCPNCGQQFLTPAHRLAKGRGRYCSKSCASQHNYARLGGLSLGGWGSREPQDRPRL